MKSAQNLYIGTAGWAHRKDQAHLFPNVGSHLERYAQIYNGVEINSSFHRNHMAKTYKRWAEMVPEKFKFSVKLSKVYTHQHKLELVDEELKKVVADICELDRTLGVLLVQLPPSLKFNQTTVERFFSKLTTWCSAPVVLEPRHITWAEKSCLQILNELNISVVNADPSLLHLPRGFDQKINYYRLHGTPEIYKSSYPTEFLEKTHQELKKIQSNQTEQNWVIFDNTTYGHANNNALEFQSLSKI